MPEDYVDYARWGEAFFADALTVERVVAGVDVMAGQPIEFGPIGVGPGRVVKASARGVIGRPTGERAALVPATFRVVLPVSLDLVIDLGMDKHRFAVDLSVPIVLAVRARGDLAIVIDVQPPTAQQVGLRLRAQGLRATLTQHAAGLEGELRRFVATYVSRELDKPYVAAARVIDVSAAVDRAIRSLGSAG